MTPPTVSDPAEVASRIPQIVNSAVNGQIRGTDLAQEIRKAFQWFEPSVFSCLTVREFVEKFVPSVGVVGKAGMDNIYGLRGAAISGAPTSENLTLTGDQDENAVRADLDIWWKAFASPSGYYKLIANTESGERKPQQPGLTMVGEPWVVVPQCSAKFFEELSREFVSTLSDDYEKGVLLSGIQTGTGLNSEFYKSIGKLNLGKPWNEFRHRRIIRHFITTLNQLGVPLAAPARTPLVRTLTASGVAQANFVNAPASESISVNRTRVQPSPQASGSREDRLRRVVLGTVARMSARDLRNLNLPLGDVLDALDDS